MGDQDKLREARYRASQADWLVGKQLRDWRCHCIDRQEYPNGKPLPIAIADHIERATGEAD